MNKERQYPPTTAQLALDGGGAAADVELEVLREGGDDVLRLRHRASCAA